LRLKIGDCEIPEAFLLYVELSIGPFPVAFGGIARGDEALAIRKRLKLLAEERAVSYEAVDKNGLPSTGICDIKDLKFQETSTRPIMIKFSGRLVHPFI
jgi:hypothetical protein